ncbi:MAG: D-isomer specific 2-hydroxyacid dehydrogenase, NAD-binding, partial [Caldanaerobacter subterraneus]
MRNILLFTKLNDNYIKEIKEQMEGYDVLYVQNEEEAEKYVKDTEIIISFDFEFYSNIVDKASNLKWIHLLSAGADTLP